MSILALQQRLVEVGRIRMGEKRTSSGGKKYPAKLATWRLTSPDVQRLSAVADVYGGEVKPWEDQHEVVTTSDALEIALIPGQALSQHMEHWGQEKPKAPVICLRRCDGERELLNDRPCPCKIEAGDDGDLLCKPTTHLMVMLRRVAGIGSWRLSTRGWYAAQELLGTAGLLEQLTARGQLVPARLRLDQRTVVKADGNKNFVVPVIDIDVALDDVFGGSALGVGGVRAIAPPAGELEAAPVPFKPVPVAELAPPPSTSTREQLTAPAPAAKRRSNAAEPIKATGLRPRGLAAVPDVETVNDEGASQIARRCSARGIGDDLRPAFLWQFSGGDYHSAHDVPVDVLGELYTAIDAANAILFDEEMPPAVMWPFLLGKVKGIGEGKLLHQARDLCFERNLAQPTSIDDIPAELNVDLRNWLDEKSSADGPSPTERHALAVELYKDAVKKDQAGWKAWAGPAGIPTDSRNWTAAQVEDVIAWITADPADGEGAQ